jgi:Bifunctional DNA primase/polymerase, N-terminal
MIKRPTFLELATAMLKRGFAVTPVDPNAKGGRLWWQYKYFVTNLSEVIQLSKDYTDHNVGIVSRRGVGNVCFLDIDGEGVLEQIEAETGHKMPETLVVQSRPQSALWKRHFYFLQTPESFAAFQKEITGIADLSITDAEGKHPNRYDLKGVGGGGYVVAPGSVRDNGEVYAFEHDKPIDEIAKLPEWLITWTKEDVHKYRSQTAKLRDAEQKKHGEATASDSPLPEYTKAEINIALWNRAWSYAPLGTRRATIERALKEQMQDFMKDGHRLAVEWADRIHDIASDPRLPIGSLKKEFLGKLKRPISIKQDERVPKPGEIFGTPPAIRRYKIMETEIATFPPSISAPEVYTRLKAALNAVDLTLARDKTDNRAVGRAMYKAGYGLDKKIWTKGFWKERREVGG